MIIKTGENKATVLLYGVIGDEVTALDLRNQLSENGLSPESELEVHIHSPGGSVFEGVAIVAALKDYNTVAVIDGLAASMASVIALACDEVEIADGAQIMVHNPWTFAFGDANELRKEAALLDQIRDDIIGIYAKRFDRDQEEVKALMQEETWINADQALEMGLADRKRERPAIAAKLRAPKGIDASKSEYLFADADDSEYFEKLANQAKQHLNAANEAASEQAKLRDEITAIKADLVDADAAKTELEAKLEDLEDELTKAKNEASKKLAGLGVTEPLPVDEGGEAEIFKNRLEEYQAMTDPHAKREFYAKHKREILNLLQ